MATEMVKAFKLFGAYMAAVEIQKLSHTQEEKVVTTSTGFVTSMA